MNIKYLLLLLVVASSSILGDKIQKTMNNKLGQTLLTTAAIQLQSNQPLDRLIDTLQDLEDRYSGDQKEDDAENREFQGNCDKDLSELETNIDQISMQISKLKGLIDQITILLNKKLQLFNDQEQIRKELRKGMNEVDVIREYEEKQYSEKRTEMGNIIKILEEVKVTYATKFRSNFMEIQSEKTPVQKEVMLEIQKSLKKHVTFKHFGKAFQEIFTFLTQVKGNNLGLLRNIIDLCGLLIKRVDQTWEVERTAEEQRVGWYEKYTKFMQSDFKKADEVYESLKEEIAKLKQRLEDSKNKLSDLEERLEGKNQRKEDRYKECQEAAYDYAERRSHRQEDRSIVSDVLGIVNVNLRDLKEEIALRMAAGQFE